MASEYNPDCYDPNHNPLVDMEWVEKNFAALRSSFSSTTAEVPAFVLGQFWADTTVNLLYYRGTSDWIPILDFENAKVIVGDGAINSQDISNAARKGSIVTDEAISPISCTLKEANVSSFARSIPGMSSIATPVSPYAVPPLSLYWFFINRTYIRTSDTVLDCMARLKSNGIPFSVWFGIEGESTFERVISTGPYIWYHFQISVFSLTDGWYDMYLQGQAIELDMQGFSIAFT